MNLLQYTKVKRSYFVYTLPAVKFAASSVINSTAWTSMIPVIFTTATVYKPHEIKRQLSPWKSNWLVFLAYLQNRDLLSGYCKITFSGSFKRAIRSDIRSIARAFPINVSTIFVLSCVVIAVINRRPSPPWDFKQPHSRRTPIANANVPENSIIRY